MSFRKSFVFATLLIAGSATAFAADAGWNGTWKFNPAKSKLTGDTFTITENGGKLHYSNGAQSYDFACDGKAYTTLANRKLTCTGSAQTGFDYTTTADGTTLSKSHRTLSANGKTLTVKGQTMHADGTTSAYEDVYKREGGTSGLAGKWVNVKTNTSPSILVFRTSDSGLHMEFPASKETIDSKLDGSDAKVVGPTIPDGALMSIKAESPTKLAVVTKYHTQVLSNSTYTLSADKKTITEEYWLPGNQGQKETEIWEKQ